MITCRLIAETVSKTYGISIRELYSDRRSGAVPRHMSWTLARHLTGKSLPEIGRTMGGVDHTSVIYGVRRIEEAMMTDPQIAANFRHLEKALGILGMITDRSVTLAFQLDDIDPIKIADAVLNSPLREIFPSLEEVRALSMGVLHYAAELESTQSRLTEQAETMEAWAIWQSPAHLANLAVVEAAKRVVDAQKKLKTAFDTSGERPARKALEAAVSNLQTVFERTSS